ncbi:MAG TPA: PD-(D/E)XK nuclease family protein [Candidatus Saccharimonadales bacterium]|jgi:CRISPR/Cas system-associated exonuclease Cas4 (RecB family)|nr:PD-(D/E)XK nuclease family protein [Candidatus Saccharimonadales bacterium]
MAKYGYRTQPYKAGQSEIFKISRSKIEDFVRCPRCFWLDRKLKISKPSTPPFQINKAVDELFKKEFDTYRIKGKAHPLMIEYGVEGIPYAHDDLNKWRENFVGVQYLHQPTNLLIYGAVDDIWVNKNGELMVVDYKATSKKSEVTLDSPWQISYKRQMEIYQWLLRQNGFEVNPTGYFVYTNGRLDLDGFFDRIEFKTKVIPYTGSDSWVEPVIYKLKECLESDTMPRNNADCEYCEYARKRTSLTQEWLSAQKSIKKTSTKKPKG